MSNGYPTDFVNKIINEHQPSSLRLREANVNQNKTITKRLPLLYVPEVFHKLCKTLKIDNITIVPYYKKTLCDVFTKLKDKTKKENIHNAIYEISCSRCSGKYIGQTKNYIKDRLNRHRLDCQYKNNATALAEHHAQTGHQFDFNNFKILEVEHNERKRLFKEMVFINRDQTSLNSQRDIQKLSNIYVNLINK